MFLDLDCLFVLLWVFSLAAGMFCKLCSTLELGFAEILNSEFMPFLRNSFYRCVYIYQVYSHVDLKKQTP